MGAVAIQSDGDSPGFTDCLVRQHEGRKSGTALFEELTMVMNNKRFEYAYASVGDLAVQTSTDAKSGKRVASQVLVNDEPIKPTERFWTSLYARYGFNKSFFKYFRHDEVFQRISEVESKDRMRLCIERDADKGENRLLAVSNPAKPIVRHEDLIETL